MANEAGETLEAETDEHGASRRPPEVSYGVGSTDRVGEPDGDQQENGPAPRERGRCLKECLHRYPQSVRSMGVRRVE